MNISAILLGEILFGFALIVAAICFFLGKQKGQNPYISGLMGFLAGLIPVVAIIYLVVLCNKPTVTSQENAG